MLIKKLLRKIGFAVVRLYAVRANVTVHRSVHIGIGSILEATRSLSVGEGTYIGKGCSITVNGTIGRGVLIANSVGIVGRLDHEFRKVGIPVRFAPWIGDDNFTLTVKQQNVQIEDDVWIGYGAIILSPLRISRGAVIAAGTVLRESVPPYAIVAGAPSRIVGYRFGEADIATHENALRSFWLARGSRRASGEAE